MNGLSKSRCSGGGGFQNAEYRSSEIVLKILKSSCKQLCLAKFQGVIGVIYEACPATSKKTAKVVGNDQSFHAESSACGLLNIMASITIPMGYNEDNGKEHGNYYIGGLYWG